jgi:hypothetical protein
LERERPQAWPGGRQIRTDVDLPAVACVDRGLRALLGLADHRYLADRRPELVQAVEQVVAGGRVARRAVERVLEQLVVDAVKRVQQQARTGFLDGDAAVGVDAACRPEQPQVDVDDGLALGAQRSGEERQGVGLARAAAPEDHLVVTAGKAREERADVDEGLDEGLGILAFGPAKEACERSVDGRRAHVPNRRAREATYGV